MTTPKGPYRIRKLSGFDHPWFTIDGPTCQNEIALKEGLASINAAWLAGYAAARAEAEELATLLDQVSAKRPECSCAGGGVYLPCLPCRLRSSLAKWREGGK